MCIVPVLALLIPVLLVLAPLSIPLLPFGVYYWYRHRKAERAEVDGGSPNDELPQEDRAPLPASEVALEP